MVKENMYTPMDQHMKETGVTIHKTAMELKDGMTALYSRGTILME